MDPTISEIGLILADNNAPKGEDEAQIKSRKVKKVAGIPTLNHKSENEFCERPSMTSILPFKGGPLGRTKAGEVTQKTRSGQDVDAPPPRSTNLILSKGLQAPGIATKKPNYGDDSDGSEDEGRKRGTKADDKSAVASKKKTPTVSEAGSRKFHDEAEIARLDARFKERRLKDEKEIERLREQLEWVRSEQQQESDDDGSDCDKSLRRRRRQEARLVQKDNPNVESEIYLAELERMDRVLKEEDQIREKSLLQGPGKIATGPMLWYELVQQPVVIEKARIWEKPILQGSAWYYDSQPPNRLEPVRGRGEHAGWGEVKRVWNNSIDSTFGKELERAGWRRDKKNGEYWRYRRGTIDGDQRYVFMVQINGDVVGVWNISETSQA
jgi:hypothetical protein